MLCRVSDALDGLFASYDPADLEGLRLARIDTTRPHPARICDFLLGGKDFPVDRDAAPPRDPRTHSAPLVLVRRQAGQSLSQQ